MKRIFASFTFRYVICVVLLQLPFVVNAATTHDVNDDGDIDLHDFASLQRCYVLPDQDCRNNHDYEPDGDIDGDDFANFESVMTDPELAPLPDAPIKSAGYPRSWEGALPVSPFSVYNLAQGNLHTAVPLVSWDPVGPPVEFTLYHNNALAAAGKSGAIGQGFDLGDGWSTSYSGRLIIKTNTVKVIEDDGTRNVFTYKDGIYKPPVGVYDRLEHVTEGGDYWLLTRTSQSQREFDSTGLLTKVRDSSGNEVTIEWNISHNIKYIKSAAEELVDGGNYLKIIVYTSYILIRDPIGREWFLRLDANGVLYEVENPHDESIDESSTLFTYDADSRLAKICRRDRVVWEHQYTDDGRLEKVVGPYASPAANPSDPPADPPPDAYEVALTDIVPISADCVWRRTFTDRREHDWLFDFDTAAPLGRLLVATHDPLTNTRSYAYDADHNVTSFTNELGNIWTATYGPVGNLETLTGPEIMIGGQPVHQTWTITWDAVGDPDTTNFYRVTEVADPVGKWAQYQYTHPNDPTLVTQVIEMPATDGGENGVTQLTYYWDEANAKGQLWRVIDANTVITEYGYDQWGYYSSFTEGLADDRHVLEPVNGGNTNNGVGQTIGGSDDTGGADWGSCINILGLLFCLDCPFLIGEDDAPKRLSNNTPAPPFHATKSCLNSATYDVMGRLTYIEKTVGDCAIPRIHDPNYDELGRLCELIIEGGGHDPNGVPPTPFSFQYTDYDPDGRLLRQIGPAPEQAANEYTYDELGRLETALRNADDELTRFGVTLYYDEAGQLWKTVYTNGTQEIRVYDDANRLTEIRHENAAEQVLYKVTYIWTINNWVDSRAEEDYTVTPYTSAFVDFEYDHRGRLISETRTLGATDVYDILYTYDQLGNRLTKTDTVALLRTDYEYDVYIDWDQQEEYDYATWHNRLLKYELYDISQTPEQKLRTVSYTYYKTGQASNITVWDEGVGPEYGWAYDLALYYHSHGPLWRALWGKYELDENNEPVEGSYVTLGAREFFNDSPRARHLAVDYNTHESSEPSEWTFSSALRTQYTGDLPYADLNVAVDETETDLLRYLGTAAQQTVSNAETAYYHGDLIGSTNLTTDDTGSAGVSPAVAYTAFGEVLTPAGSPGGPAPEGFPRYQYAGAYGYESNLLMLEGVNPNLPPITLQHLGHRWYQPDIGRFVQRDPIGIRGGLNVYEYVHSNPLSSVDHLGLWSWEKACAGGMAGLIGGAIGSGGNPAVVAGAVVAAVIAGGYEEGDLNRLSNAINESLDDYWGCLIRWMDTNDSDSLPCKW